MPVFDRFLVDSGLASIRLKVGWHGRPEIGGSGQSGYAVRIAMTEIR